MALRVLACLVLPVSLAFGLVPAARAPRPGVDWPSFRGIDARGLGDGESTPVAWNVTNGQGVKWKTPVAGLGHSSPIVWGDLVCLSTATSDAEQSLKVGLYGDIAPVNDDTPKAWKVVCVDKRSGAVRWERELHRGVPAVKRHTKATHANSTLATDGERIVAFLGSEGLHALDMKGQPLWKKDFGVLESGFFMFPAAQWGFASSPVIHDGLVIVQADVFKGSFVGAFDAKTGKEIWRTPRSDVPTWSTPTVVTGAGPAQVVVNGWRHVGGYDLKTGKELWRMQGGGDIPVPTPITAHGLIFITNAHGPASPIFAVKPTATGDISLAGDARTNDHIAWSQNREGAYMQTPLVYGDYLYVCRDNGVLSVYDARTGERKYQQRMADGKTGFTASAVAANEKIYFTSEEGTVYVIKAGPVFELLAENALGETAMATPAISEGVLFFRTKGHLVAVSSKP
jgi:outer membrane protein assembly factor BamB